MHVLVTGAAGFIGFHLVRKLSEQADVVITGIDNLNSYYNPELKYARLAECGISKADALSGKIRQSSSLKSYRFCKLDIADRQAMEQLFAEQKFDYVVNLAGQAGVRYSIENPDAYVQSNLVGFANMLECCKRYDIKHLIYASSSSVYGMGNTTPYSESDDVSHPISLYAATKKSNELMAHAYSHLFHLPTTGIRLFTVYGPWGRPDMAPILFAKAITEAKPIKVFNHGNMSRDFTYVDDVVTGIAELLKRQPDQNSDAPFYQIFNIGGSHPVKLLDFIGTLEGAIGKKAKLELLPMQAGDVVETCADVSKLDSHIGYSPSTMLPEGIDMFAKWFIAFDKQLL